MSFIIRTVEPYTVAGIFATRRDAEKAIDVDAFDPAPHIDPALCAVYRVDNDSRTVAEVERDEAIRERDEAAATIERVKRLRDHWRTQPDLQREVFDALADALTAALGDDVDDGHHRFLVDAAKDCACCGQCADVPCGGCTAGGVCDRLPCRCDDEPVDYYEDDEEDFHSCCR